VRQILIEEYQYSSNKTTHPRNYLELDYTLHFTTLFMFYRASMTIKILYYPTDAQIYNS